MSKNTGRHAGSGHPSLARGGLTRRRRSVAPRAAEYEIARPSSPLVFLGRIA